MSVPNIFLEYFTITIINQTVRMRECKIISYFLILVYKEAMIFVDQFSVVVVSVLCSLPIAPAYCNNALFSFQLF